MKKILTVLLLSLTSFCFADLFFDSVTGLQFEVPQGFELDEEESGVDEVDGNWWYVFSSPNQGILTVEIDQGDYLKTLPEHFYQSMTKEEERDGIIYEGMEFKNVNCGDLEFTKCKLRILAQSNQLLEPLFVCDCLFVRKHFAFTISLIKRENELVSNEESDAMILSLMQSIQFNR